MLATRHAPVTLYSSLFALLAVGLVSGISMTNWTTALSDKLNSSDFADNDIPEGAVIGGVAQTQGYGLLISPPPAVPYRPANERLPSQQPDLFAAPNDNTRLTSSEETDELPLPDTQVADPLPADTAPVTEPSSEMAPYRVASSNLAPKEDTLARQAAILTEMRAASPTEAATVSR